MQDKEIVTLRNVTVRYDDIVALEDVSLSIHDGDFMGIIGPNGGGKTSLLKLLLGVVSPTKGEVRVFGKPPRRTRRLIGYVPQHTEFDPGFPISAWEVVLMGRLGRKRIGSGYDKGDVEAAQEALDTVEMAAHTKRQMGKLSGGQQQRILLARALVTEPKLLLLDEPTAGIDAPTRTGFYELLNSFKERMSIVLVSHDITAVSVYVSKIACLNRRLFCHDSKELTAEDLEATYKCPVEMIAHGVPHRVLKEHT
jgi:zinc transport system ATP-binding protein